MTSSLGGKRRPPSGSGASGAAATKPSPPVTLAKLRGVNSSNTESTLVMSRGRGDIGGGGPTVPMMPIMSPAGNTAGKKVDYAKYLSPVDPKPQSGNRSRKSGDSRGRGSPPPYHKKLEQVMPGIHSSSSNNTNDVHVRREVEW